jgi:hypothetical protein
MALALRTAVVTVVLAGAADCGIQAAFADGTTLQTATPTLSAASTNNNPWD